MDKYTMTILSGIVLGTISRMYLLRIDYRMYPSYPHGFLTHLFLGFIASALGAVAVPALAEKDYTAVTFLALAAQQFREIRGMERESLVKIDQSDLVPRGPDFIEGIAKTFEARNYLVMMTSLTTSAVTYFGDWPLGITLGVFALGVSGYFMQGQTVGDFADVVPAELHFDGAMLKINEIVIMNVGLKDARKKILQDGLAVIIKPKNDNARATLDNIGQRQAILHLAAALLGTKKDIGELDFTPMARKNIDTGEIGVFIVPNEKDIECLIAAVKKVPVIESAKRRPLASRIGKKAAD